MSLRSFQRSVVGAILPCYSYKGCLIRDNRGFTLLDLSVMLMVIGLLSVPILHSIKIYYKEKTLTTTNNSFLTVDTAIEQFYFLNGHYPCPSDITIQEDDIRYGSATPCDPIAGADPAVGGVPFKALKIPFESTLDGHGNRISYSVSIRLTSSGTFTPNGTLNFRHRRIDDTVVPPVMFWDNATDVTGHYALVSHGRNDGGAFAAGGGIGALNDQPILPCVVAGDPQLEDENCNGDGIFITHTNLYNPVPGVDFYDDRVHTQNQAPTRIWMNHPENADDIFSNAGLIGVGTDDPQVELDVDGNIVTRGGSINLIELCDPDISTDNCFEAETIGGVGIECPTTAGIPGAMTALAEARLDCGAIASGNTGTCPSSYIVGFDAGGNAICGP